MYNNSVNGFILRIQLWHGLGRNINNVSISKQVWIGYMPPSESITRHNFLSEIEINKNKSRLSLLMQLQVWPPCDILCISLLLERRYGHSYEISCFSFTNASHNDNMLFFIDRVLTRWNWTCYFNCCGAAQSAARNDFWTPGKILMGKVLHIIQGRYRNASDLQLVSESLLRKGLECKRPAGL